MRVFDTISNIILACHHGKVRKDEFINYLERRRLGKVSFHPVTGRLSQTKFFTPDKLYDGPTPYHVHQKHIRERFEPMIGGHPDDDQPIFSINSDDPGVFPLMKLFVQETYLI